MKLNTWQRIMLSNIVGQAKGNVNFMRRAIKAMDALELTEEEKVEVGVVQLPNGNIQWVDSVKTFDIDMAPEVESLVKKAFQAYDDWQGSQAKRVIQLAEVLGVE